MKKRTIKTALSVLFVPLILLGCAKSQGDSQDKSKELADGERLTSVNVTNFDGLSEMIKREKIPDNAIICTVGSDAINVGDYKLEFRFKQEQAKQLLQQAPAPPRNLLKDAIKQGFKLSDREREEFLAAAYKQGGTTLQEKLKSGSIKKEEFEKSVLDMGVILKAINANIEKQLLNEIINNSLLLHAARKNGLGKIAFNKYVEIKHSPQYRQLLANTKLTESQFKDHMLEGILVSLMSQKIIEQAIVRDKDIFEFYKANKKNFTHNGRIKWSQILIEDPERDFQAFLSIRTQVDRKYPKLTPKQKLAKIEELKEEQKKKALEICKKAKAGIDFAKLANENTDDIPARASKTGGDMGYIELDELKRNRIFKTVANSLSTMVENEVYPKPIKSMIGWHIIKLTEIQKPGTLPFEEAKEEVKRDLVAQNSGMAVQSWIMHQREIVPIKISKRFRSFLSKTNNLNMDKNGSVFDKPEESSKPKQPEKKEAKDSKAPLSK